MGSKKKLLPQIKSIIDGLPNINTVLDGFSGSVRVSNYLKSDYTIISNDKQHFSECLANCYLLNRNPQSFYQDMIQELNSLPGKEGWFSETYGGIVMDSENSAIQSDGKKRIWQIHNANRVDSIREKIEEYDLDPVQKSVLLTSLIEGLNRVSNVLGHQNGYLKNWSSNSYHNLVLQVPNFVVDNKPHQVYRDDIFEVLPQVECDVAYYDPPYGTVNKNLVVATRYTAFYHLWNTLVLNDQPEIFGKANRRLDSKDNTDDFERNKKEIILPLFEKLFRETNSRYILFSYSNKGLVSKEEMEQIFENQNLEYQFNIVSHQENTQSTSATKEGKWKDYEPTELKEYLILVKK